jgi:DNA-binding response OmpR family regulator
MNPEPSIVRAVTVSRELAGAEVLVVDQDTTVHKGTTQLLSAASMHVTCTTDPEEALGLVDRRFFSVMLVDIDTPAPSAGLDTVRALKERSPTSMIIAMTPRRSFDDAVAAVRVGAIDLILKAPESVAYLRERVLDAAGRSVGRREIDHVLVDIRNAQEEFLSKFMDAERRALDLTDRLAGRDPGRTVDLEELLVLVVDEADSLMDALGGADKPGFTFIHATSGGEALDRASSGRFHYAMVAEDLHDLPTSMVVRSMRAQNQELVVLTFMGPAETGGKVELVETHGQRTIIDPFTDASQLLGRLDELAEAYRAKSRERRYTQNFRERHYDFLRRYVELKVKIDRALHDGPG